MKLNEVFGKFRSNLPSGKEPADDQDAGDYDPKTGRKLTQAEKNQRKNQPKEEPGKEEDEGAPTRSASTRGTKPTKGHGR